VRSDEDGAPRNPEASGAERLARGDDRGAPRARPRARKPPAGGARLVRLPRRPPRRVLRRVHPRAPLPRCSFRPRRPCPADRRIRGDEDRRGGAALDRQGRGRGPGRRRDEPEAAPRHLQGIRGVAGQAPPFRPSGRGYRPRARTREDTLDPAAPHAPVRLHRPRHRHGVSAPRLPDADRRHRARPEGRNGGAGAPRRRRDRGGRGVRSHPDPDPGSRRCGSPKAGGPRLRRAAGDGPDAAGTPPDDAGDLETDRTDGAGAAPGGGGRGEGVRRRHRRGGAERSLRGCKRGGEEG